MAMGVAVVLIKMLVKVSGLWSAGKK